MRFTECINPFCIEKIDATSQSNAGLYNGSVVPPPTAGPLNTSKETPFPEVNAISKPIPRVFARVELLSVYRLQCSNLRGSVKHFDHSFIYRDLNSCHCPERAGRTLVK